MAFDVIIIGSGFGASVSALRLTEKGYRVLVIEKGKRFQDQDFAKNNWQLRKFLWAPIVKCFGIQAMSFFNNVVVLHGAGVGGGSLVYANTLVKPKKDFFHSPTWRHLADWENELDPYYEVASRMLGAAPNPRKDFADDLICEVANEMGRGDTFSLANVGVFFGKPGEKVSDPYFGGEGPDRRGCTFCGACMVGCREGAKNTLVKNYLYLAEKRGCTILPEREVTNILPLEGGGYQIDTVSSTAWFFKAPQSFQAKKVVIGGGVLGTLKLLFRCRDITKSLTNLSPKLGFDIRTNSESLLGVIAPDLNRPLNQGIAISSIFHPDPHTHIEPVKYPTGSTFMRVLAAPMADRGRYLPRPIVFFWNIIAHPLNTVRFFVAGKWAERALILLVMQTLDSRMRITLGRGLLTFFRKGLVTKAQDGALKVPSYIPLGHDVAKSIAKKIGGMPANAVNEVLFGVPATAHILGGCPMGKSSDEGVVNPDHEVHGYPGLYVCDGSTVGANPGVNPSLTITAMAERAMKKIPPNGVEASAFPKLS